MQYLQCPFVLGNAMIGRSLLPQELAPLLEENSKLDVDCPPKQHFYSLVGEFKLPFHRIFNNYENIIVCVLSQKHGGYKQEVYANFV